MIGFDLNPSRIKQLKDKVDVTLEITADELDKAENLAFSSNISDIEQCNCYIIAVPTPIDEFNSPDLNILLSATSMIGNLLKKGDIVIYESTVYPGATEEDCVPVLEKISGLKFNQDFFCGYSPERINPGDKEHKVKDIVKVTSGSTPETAEIVDNLYKEIIEAGTYKADSIKVAEAAKVIENTQRDLNIALINELSVIFNKMDIDTHEVLNAAKTKWNFIPFSPGLVGGHCIGVDPYYLTHKSESLGYKPEIILAGRKLNDEMSDYVANNLLESLSKVKQVEECKVLILGFTFKENCPDLRNTKIIDLYNNLVDHVRSIDVYDPYASKSEAKEVYKLDLLDNLVTKDYDAVVIAVSHDEFRKMGIKEIRKLCSKDGIIYDLKNLFRNLKLI